MIRTLLKAIVQPFYSAHAGFFMVLLFFLGGFLRAQEHITIARHIASSDFLTLIMLSLFIIFHAKTIIFTRFLLQKNQYLFLRNFPLLSFFRQSVMLFVVQVSINAMIIAYGVFVSKYMLEIAAYQRLVMIASFLILSITASSWMMIRQLKLPVSEQKSSLLTRFSNQKFEKPYVLWFLIHLIKNRPALFVLSKVLSIGLLVGCFSVYDTDSYDWRFLGVGTVFAMSANLMLAHECFSFYTVRLVFFRNLPISIVSRIIKITISIFILLLPEAIVIIRQLPDEVSYYFAIQMISYGTITCTFYYHWMLFENDTIEQLGKACFFFTIAQAFLVLFGMPLYLITLLLLVFVFTTQLKYYSAHDY